MGVRHENVIMCDRKGTIYQGRTEGMDQWKSAHAVPTEARDLTEALVGADVFLVLSAAGALKPEMVKDMAPAPIIFAIANPDHELLPPAARPASTSATLPPRLSAYSTHANTAL